MPHKLDFDLDVFGQLPSLHIYTQICLCFSVPDPSSHSTIINTLTNGLERLSASFPWIAGQVVNEGNPGIYYYKIKPLERIPRLVVRDLRNDPSIPTMDDMKQANFPMSVLDETIIAPRNTLPGTTCGEPTPVFLLQANFIIGGLLLTFVGGHQTMDMTGQAQIIRLLAKACHNEEFTSEEVLWGNHPRRDIIPFLDKPCSEKPTPSLLPIIPDRRPSSAPSPPPKSSWANFSFHPTSLAALKTLATKTISSGYISTDDTLSAFIWQSVVRARLPRLDPSSETTFARAVDPRRYLDIPQIYTGVVQNMTYFRHTLRKLVDDESLGSLASRFRLAIDPITSNLGYDTRALATNLKENKGTTAGVVETLDLSSDTWARENFYELDFNLGLGKPESVRRPKFSPVESLIYIIPKRLDGELVVAICLRDEDMERLRVDEEFTKYGKYIG